MRIGEVAELWVYPVKSMRGLRVLSVPLELEGLRGDRRVAYQSSNAPAGKPLVGSRERAAMLRYVPVDTDASTVRTPDGKELKLEAEALRAEFQTAASNALSEFRLLRSPGRPLTDVRPVSLISTATLQELSKATQQPVDPRRFRSNIVVRLDSAVPFAEDEWSGRTLRFRDETNSAELSMRERIPRCRMVSLDPETAEPDNVVLKHLAKKHEGRVGIYATVLRPGLLCEGQSLFLL